jgi:hypothetical protein
VTRAGQTAISQYWQSRKVVLLLLGAGRDGGGRGGQQSQRRRQIFTARTMGSLVGQRARCAV